MHPKDNSQSVEEWEAEKAATGLPGLGYDWTTIDDYNAAQAWAVEAYLAGAVAHEARVRAAVAADIALEIELTIDGYPENGATRSAGRLPSSTTRG